MADLANRVALVTGSSRGIGAAIAELFARHGAAVAVHGRDAAAVATTTSAIEAAGGRAIGVTCELTRFDDIEAARHRIEDTLGPVDIVVANAGGNPARPAPLETLDEDAFRRSIDVNLTATFLTIKSFLPGMKQRGRGSIITMSSAASRRPTAHSPLPYAAAKAGIEVLTRGLATQAGPSGVRVNCIAPETILTERNLAMIPADTQEQMRVTHPIQRLGIPMDVASAALFFASDDAAWITGVVLDVAGGSVLA